MQSVLENWDEQRDLGLSSLWDRPRSLACFMASLHRWRSVWDGPSPWFADVPTTLVLISTLVVSTLFCRRGRGGLCPPPSG